MNRVLIVLLMIALVAGVSDGQSRAAASSFVLDNPDMSATIDPADGARVVSLIQKSTGREFAINDPADGGMCRFIVTDEWPNPSDGAYESAGNPLAAQSRELAFERSAGGWTFRKTFSIPARGTRLTVELSATNTSDAPREIVPVVQDRPNLNAYGFDGDSLVTFATADNPMIKISYDANGWFIPVRNWFGIAGNPANDLLWVTVDYDKMNAILLQSGWRTRGATRPFNGILGWCYVPVILKPGETWSTTYTYGFAQGMPEITSASTDFAISTPAQHFLTVPASIPMKLASTINGTIRIACSLRTSAGLRQLANLQQSVSAGNSIRFNVPVGGVGGVGGDFSNQASLIFTVSGAGFDTQTMDITLFVAPRAPFQIEQSPRNVKTSGVIADRSGAKYYVRSRTPNDLTGIHPAFAGGSLSAWWMNSLSKVHPDDAVDTAQTASTSIDLLTVKGGTAAAQLVLRNDADAAISVGVKCSGLTNSSNGIIDAEHVSIFEEKYVQCSEVSDVVRGAVGSWPDGLVPVSRSFTIPPHVATAVWLDFAVPRDTSPGVYSGSIDITPPNGGAVSLPVQLEVANVTLPVTSFLRGNFSSSIPAANRIMLAHRLQPGGLGVPYHSGSNYDFTAFDAEVDALLALGLNTFQVLNRTTPNPRMLQHLKDRNLLGMNVVYTIDEPGENIDPAWLQDNYGKLHDIDPGIRVLATVEPYQAAEGLVDVWVPLSINLNIPMARRMQARGNEVWWYVCAIPKWPAANFFIDYQSVDHLALFWQTYQFGLDGILYWGVYAYTRGQDPWTDPFNQIPNANGDGYLLYPLNGGRTPSIRLKVLREGVEIYDLMKMLDRRIRELESSEPQNPRINEGHDLLDLSDLTDSVLHYQRDPAIYEDRRREIIQLLDTLG